MGFSRYFAISSVVHALAVSGLLVWLSTGNRSLEQSPITEFQIVSVPFDSMPHNSSSRPGSHRSKTSAGQPLHSEAKIDLKPAYMNGGAALGGSSQDTKGIGSAFPNGDAREMLFTESRVFEVFDLLAAKIGNHLDYPLLLAENGVQGTASLDLFFDGDGNIDQQKSRFFGSHRCLRGLLTKATRIGIVEWFVHDANRLKKTEFRNQHFRADFVLSDNLDQKFWDSNPLNSTAELQRATIGSYHFVRKRSFTCATATGIDMACAAIRAGGAIKNLFGGKRKSEFSALVDRLEYYDQVGLDGVNLEIVKASS